LEIDVEDKIKRLAFWKLSIVEKDFQEGTLTFDMKSRLKHMKEEGLVVIAMVR
jgi:hypothetical protein